MIIMKEKLRESNRHVVEQTCIEDPATVVALLKACGRKRNLKKVSCIHADIVKDGLFKSNTYVGNTLISMYAKCGAVKKAQEVFDKLPSKDVVSWNSLISGYAYRGSAEEALNVYQKMKQDGFPPDAATFICILKACGSIRAINKGLEIHGEIVRGGWLGKQLMIGTALVDMYAKCGAMSSARKSFDELPFRDVVSWNVLIAGYGQHGGGEEALICYQEMQCQGVSPTSTTFVCVLKACGNMGSAETGEEIHAEIKREGLVKINALVGTALVDMYVRCGSLAKAQEVFDELSIHDVVAWNTLLAGYGQRGKCDTVADLFRKMLLEGFFNESIMVIKFMPFSADLTVWLTLLGACRKWGNVDLGLLAFQNAVKMDEKDASAYLLMSSVYTSAGMMDHANEIKTMRVERKAWKLAHQCLCDEE